MDAEKSLSSNLMLPTQAAPINRNPSMSTLADGSAVEPSWGLPKFIGDTLEKVVPTAWNAARGIGLI